MSLEERIRRFAEQARGYLLEEFAKSLQQDTTVVKWQGYGQDGKLVVKNKDLTPTVDGVGQKYVTKGSDLILDSTGSVEQRKARRKQPAPIPPKKLRGIPPETLVPRSAIIIFPEFEDLEEAIQTMIVGIYVMYYTFEWADFYDKIENNTGYFQAPQNSTYSTSNTVFTSFPSQTQIKQVCSKF